MELSMSDIILFIMIFFLYMFVVFQKSPRESDPQINDVMQATGPSRQRTAKELKKISKLPDQVRSPSKIAEVKQMQNELDKDYSVDKEKQTS